MQHRADWDNTRERANCSREREKARKRQREKKRKRERETKRKNDGKKEIKKERMNERFERDLEARGQQQKTLKPVSFRRTSWRQKVKSCFLLMFAATTLGRSVVGAPRHPPPQQIEMASCTTRVDTIAPCRTIPNRMLRCHNSAHEREGRTKLKSTKHSRHRPSTAGSASLGTCSSPSPATNPMHPDIP